MRRGTGYVKTYLEIPPTIETNLILGDYYPGMENHFPCSEDIPRTSRFVIVEAPSERPKQASHQRRIIMSRGARGIFRQRLSATATRERRRDQSAFTRSKKALLRQ